MELKRASLRRLKEAEGRLIMEGLRLPSAGKGEGALSLHSLLSKKKTKNALSLAFLERP